MGSISSCCNANDINPDEQRDKMKASKRKGSLETASGSATQSRGPGGQLRAFEAISQGHCSTRRLKRSGVGVPRWLGERRQVAYGCLRNKQAMVS